MAVPIVKIRGVSKSFGTKQVLNDVSLDIIEGEIFGVIGMSGAGKTTLLHSIVGFTTLNKGEIAFKRDKQGTYDFASLKQDPNIKKEIGFSSQDPSFYDKLTVRENLTYFAKLYNIPESFISARVQKIIDLVELTGDGSTLASELSGGMQKRLDIACSLINDPKILILDEPTADLDPLLRKHIWQLIKKIKQMGKTIIISSHFLEEMDNLCDRIGLIYNKEIAHLGTTDEFRKTYPYNKEIILGTASQDYKMLAGLLRGLPIVKMTQRGSKMVIYTQDAELVLRQLVSLLDKQGETITDLEVQRPTLDEVFVSIVNNGNGVV